MVPFLKCLDALDECVCFMLGAYFCLCRLCRGLFRKYKDVNVIKVLPCCFNFGEIESEGPFDKRQINSDSYPGENCVSLCKISEKYVVSFGVV